MFIFNSAHLNPTHSPAMSTFAPPVSINKNKIGTLLREVKAIVAVDSVEKTMFHRPMAVFVLTACMSACAEAPDISDAVRQPLVCIYKVLKSTSTISSVDAYVDAHRNAIIEYGFHDSHGHVSAMDLFIFGPQSNGLNAYEGDYMDDSANPLIRMDAVLRDKCNAEGAYGDQVIVVRNPPPPPRRWQIDPSTF